MEILHYIALACGAAIAFLPQIVAALPASAQPYAQALQAVLAAVMAVCGLFSGKAAKKKPGAPGVGPALLLLVGIGAGVLVTGLQACTPAETAAAVNGLEVATCVVEHQAEPTLQVIAECGKDVDPQVIINLLKKTREQTALAVAEHAAACQADAGAK